MGQLTISMAIFNSYVKLPEGSEAIDIYLVDLQINNGELSYLYFTREYSQQDIPQDITAITGHT